MTMNSPAPVKTGGIRAAESDTLANDGTRTTDLVGQLLIMQPLRSRTWTTANGERDVTIARVIEVKSRSEWIDHGDLPVFWGAVRRALTEQSSERFPWVVGRVIQKAQSNNPAHNPPYLLVAPTPDELAAANAALGEWVATPAPTFEPREAAAVDPDEPF
jgi:hypothetical protein